MLINGRRGRDTYNIRNVMTLGSAQLNVNKNTLTTLALQRNFLMHCDCIVYHQDW